MLNFNKHDSEILKLKGEERFYYYINEVIQSSVGATCVNDVVGVDTLSEKWHVVSLRRDDFLKLRLNEVSSISFNDAISVYNYAKLYNRKIDYAPILSFYNEPAETFDCFESNVHIERTDCNDGCIKKAATIFTNNIGKDCIDAYMSEDRGCFYIVVKLGENKPMLCKIKDGVYEETSCFNYESLDKLTKINRCTLAYKLAVRDMFIELRKRDEIINSLERTLDVAHDAYQDALIDAAEKDKELTKMRRFKWFKWFKK